MNINLREKKLLLSTIAISVVLLGYFYVIEPIINSQQEVAIELSNNINMLNQNQLRLNRRPKLEENLNKLKEEYSKLEERLLSGDKAPLAAAELQKIIKSILRSEKVSILSEKVLEPQDMGDSYQRIAVQITIKCLATNLKKVMYEILNNSSSVLLNIPEIDVKVDNQRKPKDVKATIIVEGAIRKEKPNV